jgi:hypothetical protein
MAEDTREPREIDKQPITPLPSEQTSETESEEVAKDPASSHNELETTNTDLRNKCGEIDNSNLHYEGSICVYTDPVTKYQYTWDSNKTEWVLRSEEVMPLEEGDLERSGENMSKSESEVQSNTTTESKLQCPLDENKTPRNAYEFDGESYCYKDLKTGKNIFE